MPDAGGSRNRGSGEEAGVRDDLARVRTLLANERTLLAYTRTALALILSGATAIQFLGGPVAFWSGGLLILLGTVCLAVGGFRCLKIARRLKAGDNHPL